LLSNPIWTILRILLSTTDTRSYSLPEVRAPERRRTRQPAVKAN